MFSELIMPNSRHLILSGLFVLCSLIYPPGLNAQAVEASQADSNLSNPDTLNSSLSNYSLGVEAYQQGEFRRAFDAWSLGAYEGDVEAQYNLGVLYLEGHGVTRNLDQARDWFFKAAQKRHPEAQYNLGHMALSGMGLKKDPDAALKWWQQAAEGGYAPAQFNYGRALYLGVGGHQDQQAGIALVRTAAAQDDQRAQKFLEQHAISQPEESAQLAVADVEQAPVAVSDESLERASTAKKAKNAKTVDQGRSEVTEYQSGGVKLNIIRDQQEVRSDYFLRTVDRPIPIYALPDFSSQLDMLGSKTLLKVLAMEADKLKVEVVTGLVAWANQTDLEQHDGFAKAPLSGVVMFQLPGDSPLGEVPQNIELRVIEQHGEWLKLNIPQHVFGWIKARSLAYSGESNLQLRREWARQLSTLNGRSQNPDKVDMSQVKPTLRDQTNQTHPEATQFTAPVVPLSQAQAQAQAQAVEGAIAVNDNTWLFTQAQGAYVVHVFTLLDQLKALEIASKPQYRSHAKLYTTQAKQQTWSFLLLGPYVDLDTAKIARSRLPAHLEKGARVRSIALIAENRCKKQFELSKSQARGLDAFCLE